MNDTLVFSEEAAAQPADLHRADIACFVGLVARRAAPGPETRRWLRERGWERLRPAALDDLLDVPVPITSWSAFDRLFAADRRPLDGSGRVGATYLGAAVRSFFAQGGRMCYVISVGDPLPLTAPRAERAALLSALLPGYPSRFDATASDPESWRGAGHLCALDDVAAICLPDLADILAFDRPPPPTERTIPPLPELFVPCSEDDPPEPLDRAGRRALAPRLDEEGYAAWAQAINLLASFVARRRRDVQVVAALPLPAPGTTAERDPLLALGGAGPLGFGLDDRREGVASAFVQLVYPWARTPGGDNLPEALEPPDGLLAGLLARGALASGGHRSVAGRELGDVYNVAPELGREALRRPRPNTTGGAREQPLIERVSIIGPTPAGWRLRSDVTTSLDECYRPAPVNRLIAAIVRAARSVGEDSVFEASGERAWAQVRRGMEALLRQLLVAGALRGERPSDAFTVRCDRTTMSQNDIDAGRMVVSVTVSPAAPIERITVVLALSAGGHVAVVG